MALEKKLLRGTLNITKVFNSIWKYFLVARTRNSDMLLSRESIAITETIT